MEDNYKRDRVRGAIVGVCVCDALGGPLQFQKYPPKNPVTGLRYISQFDAPPGSWSDDGSLTLCLANSFTKDGFDEFQFVQQATSWRENGYLSSKDEAFDVGGATAISLRIWSKGMRVDADFKKIQEAVDAALNRERQSGNGSLMRCAPVGFMTAPLLTLSGDSAAHSLIRHTARQQSQLTHPYSVNGDTCALYASLVSMAAGVGLSNIDVKGEMARQIAQEDISDRKLRERLTKYKDLADWCLPPESMRSTGWVIDTIECALWAFFTTTTFRDGALKAVNLCGDSDTVGAVYGGLAGAYYGYNNIPKEWREGIVKRDKVEEIADNFTKVAFQLA